MPPIQPRTPSYGTPRDPDDEDEVEQDQAVIEPEQPDTPVAVAPVMPRPSAPGTRAYSRPAPVATPQGPVTGTTGGLVPTQAGTWDAKPVAAARWSDDPVQRRQEAVARAEADFTAKQLADNPFMFSGAVKSLAKEGGRQYIRRAIQDADREYDDQLTGDRNATIEQRRVEAEQRKIGNEAAIQQMLATGQKYRRDEFGNIQPILDARGQPLYTPTKWERTKHPKTGRPMLGMLDQHRQRQFKAPPIVDSTDPLDDYMYADFGEGASEPYMTKEEAAASDDISLKTKGLAALKKQRAAKAGERLGGLREAVDSSARDYDLAIATVNANRERAQQIAQAGGDPAEAARLEQEAIDLEEQTKPRGPMALRKLTSRIDLDLEQAALRHETRLIQRDEIAARVIRNGGDVATDPGYLANEAALAEDEAKLNQHRKARDAVSKLMEPVAPVAAAPVVEQPGALRQTGRAMARGATAEGIYATAEGLSRMLEMVGRTGWVPGFGKAPPGMEGAAKWYGDAVKDVRENIRRALPVDEKFARSLWGQISQGVGQVGSTAVAALATGGVGVAGSSVGQIYDEAYQDALRSGANDFTAHEAAVKYLPASVLDTLADRLVVGKLLKPLVGKMTVGQLTKDILKTGLVEGSTEGAQQAYLNAVAKSLAGYAPDRPFDQDVLDSFLVGMALGGGATGVGKGARMIGQKPDSGAAATPTPPTPDGAPAGNFPVEDAPLADDPLNPPIRPLSPEDEALAAALEGQGAETAPLNEPAPAPPAAETVEPVAEVPPVVAEETVPAGEAVATEVAPVGEVAAEEAGTPPVAANPVVPVTKRPKKGTPAPAEFIGIQEGLPARGNRPAVADIELYNLTADIPGHPAGSSVSRETLEKAGFKVPVREGVVATLGQESVATSTVAGGEAQGNTGPAEAVVNSPTQRIEELARQGFTALQIAARIDSTKEAVQKAARESGIALPLKSSRKPDIVMTPIMPEPTPRSREQALNNADLGMKPVSMLTRAEKRAELDAAGITTYRGKSLDEANPAEISAAVGKLRRGELTPDGEKTAESTQSLSVRAEAALKKLKIDTRDKVFSGETAIAAAAWNTALDLAIVAIKAGRTVAEAVRLAVARYKALHKGATEDEITRLSTAVESAGKEPPPTPSEPGPGQPPSGQGFTGPVNPGAPEFRRRSKSSLGEYEYVATTNAGQEKYAKEFADWHEKNGTPDSAMSEMRAINEPAMRSAVAAELLGRTMEQWQKASVADKPALASRAASIIGSVKADKTEAAQALQAQSMVNDRLRPFAPLLAWMDLLRTRYATEIEPKVGADALPQVKKGIKDAGDEAAQGLEDALSEKAPKRAQAEAERIVNAFARTQSDTQAWGDPAKTGPVRDLVADFIAKRITAEQFQAGLTKLGVKESTGSVLQQEAERQMKTKEFAQWFKNNEAINAWLKKNEAVMNLLRRYGRSAGVKWSDLFSSLPEQQEARKTELFDRVKADPKLANLTDPQKKLLAERLDESWTFLRNQILRQEFGRLVNLPNIRPADAQKIRSVVGDLIRFSNLGLLDNEAFLSAMADKYGLEKLDGPTATKFTELAAKMQSAKNDAERARTALEMYEAVSKARGLSVADAAMSGFYSNLLNSLVTTVYAMGGGNMVNAVWNLGTLATSNPFLAPRLAGSVARGFKTGVPEGLRQALSILATGHGGEDAAAMLVEARGEPLEMLAKGGVWPEFEAKYPKAAKGLQIAAHGAKMVPRLARAIDAAFYYPSKQAALRFLTEQSMLARYPDAATRHRKAAEALRVTPEDFAKAEQKAKDEGFDGLDMSLRIADILEPKSALQKIAKSSETARYLTQQRREAQASSVGAARMEEGGRLGAKTTLSQDPEGWAGVFYDKFSKTVEEVRPGGLPILKLAFPFLRLPTNFYNANLASTPFGAVAAKIGDVPTTKKAGGERVRRPLTQNERNQLYMQSLIGSTAMAYFVLKAIASDPEDEEAFDITANGPADKTLRRQMEQSGWKPKSIRIPGTNTRVDYMNTPMAMPLTMAGHIADAYRYSKQDDELILGSALTDAAVRFPSVVFGLPALSGMQELGDLLDEENVDADKVSRFLTRSAKNFVRPRLIDEVDRIFDPVVRREGVIQYDELGQPIERSPLSRVAKTESSDPLRQVLLKRKLKIPSAGRDTRVGKDPMTPEQYSEYLRLSGGRIKARLDPLVPLLQRLPSEQAQNRINQITSEERERAKTMLRRSALTPVSTQ